MLPLALLLTMISSCRGASMDKTVLRAMPAPSKHRTPVEYAILPTPSEYKWRARLHGGDGTASPAYKATGTSRTRSMYKAVIEQNSHNRWTNKTIPYELKSRWGVRHTTILQAAMGEWMKYTCVKFVPRTDQNNYIEIDDSDGCSAWVGMRDFGKQQMSLSVECRQRRTILHELGHAIGFYHEHNRSGRDAAVTIQLENVYSGQRHNFGSRNTQNDDIPYDYRSIMHYGQYFFSRNRRPTIIAKNETMQRVMGTSRNLSFLDVKHANIIYNCASHCEAKVCEGDGYLDKDCQCMCRSKNAHEPTVLCGSEPACEDYNGNTWLCEAAVQHARLVDADLCNDRYTRDYYKRRCRKTCGHCGVQETSSESVATEAPGIRAAATEAMTTTLANSTPVTAAGAAATATWQLMTLPTLTPTEAPGLSEPSTDAVTATHADSTTVTAAGAWKLMTLSTLTL